MRRILVFNNFRTSDEKHISRLHQNQEYEYVYIGPGKFRSNPYLKTKHIVLSDLFLRVMFSVILAGRSLRYDVLAVDSAITALLVACFLPPFVRPKTVVMSFNVLRRRKGPARLISAMLFRRVDRFIVHSRYDIELSSRLYNIPTSRFSFQPFQREPFNIADGPPDLSWANSETFLLSLGGNARDYGTLFKAVDGLQIRVVVVAREYNLLNLKVPPNVTVFTNIPLDHCDFLLSKSHFTIFTFDGSEPSCGQISVVSSFMAGKPVVCTDWLAMHDYVTPGQNGLFVKMADPDDLRQTILKLVGDPQLHQHLAAGAVEWANVNSNPAAKERWINQLFAELCNDVPRAES